MARSLSAQWHELSRPGDGGRPDALIVLLFEEGRTSEAQDLAAQWAPSIPHCAFAGLELDLTARWLDLVFLRVVLLEAAARHGLQSGQVVLVGAGPAAEVAIDLGLLGVVPGAAVITLDLPLEPTAAIVAPARASVRMVQRSTLEDPQGARFHAIVEALKREHVDVRSQLVPELDTGAGRAMQRAAGAFLAELAAKASRLAPIARSWP